MQVPANQSRSTVQNQERHALKRRGHRSKMSDVTAKDGQKLMEPDDSVLQLDATYLHLSDGEAVTPVPVGPNFWSEVGTGNDLQGGRLMMVSLSRV